MRLDKKTRLQEKRRSVDADRVSLNRPDLPISRPPLSIFSNNKSNKKSGTEFWVFTAVFVYGKYDQRGNLLYYEKEITTWKRVKIKAKSYYDQVANKYAWSADQAKAELRRLIREARKRKLSGLRVPFKNFRVRKQTLTDEFMTKARNERMKTLLEADIFGDA
jgi:hypothetical protein